MVLPQFSAVFRRALANGEWAHYSQKVVRRARHFRKQKLRRQAWRPRLSTIAEENMHLEISSDESTEIESDTSTEIEEDDYIWRSQILSRSQQPLACTPPPKLRRSYAKECLEPDDDIFESPIKRRHTAWNRRLNEAEGLFDLTTIN